ncbi:MAG TPA: hypothetical protein VHH36_09365 [Candidatus Thermoplasmatota archaeon]|nr:hypothetical protein [Candidatus Thermoplasmatota archaeon]
MPRTVLPIALVVAAGLLLAAPAQAPAVGIDLGHGVEACVGAWLDGGEPAVFADVGRACGEPPLLS